MVFQANRTRYSEQCVVRPTAIVTDLTVPVVRAAVARYAVHGPTLTRLRRLCGGYRTSEIELIAGDPDAMHDHRKFASHGDGGALHAPALGDGDTPSPERRLVKSRWRSIRSLHLLICPDLSISPD